jgi:hypothetical protein
LFGVVAARCLFLPLGAQTAAVIYSNDFESVAGPEWSVQTKSVTPLEGRKFLGEFGNETVSVTLTNLPAHTNLHVSFDLILLRSWDGNGATGGPEVFDFRLAGSSTALLHRNFRTTPIGDKGFPTGTVTSAPAPSR